MPRAPRWTDAELTVAVAKSTSLSQVCRRLGLVPGRYDTLRRHIARLDLDISHLPAASTSGRRRWRISDEQFIQTVRESKSIAEVLRNLGYQPNGGMHRMIVRKIKNFGLDTSHFVGQGWARGLKRPSKSVTPLAEIMVANSTYQSTAKLRRRLITEGLKKPECEGCGLRTWRGEPLPLALDHINGDHTDNRLENLRILCPNCHALTDTWCSRNRKPA
jgi:hypothetical protein